MPTRSRRSTRAPGELRPGETPDASEAGPEMEVFYTFTWGRQARGDRKPRGGQRGDRDGGKPQGKGRRGDRGDRGDKGRGPKGAKGKGPRPDKGAKTYQSRPEKKDRIDPDNPFAAALMGLKDKG